MRKLIFVVLLAGCGNVPNKNSDMAVGAGSDMAGGGGGGNPGDLGPSCTAGQPCQAGTGSGLCTGGSCNACTDTTDDANCTTVYGAGFLCIGGQCLQGCRTPADCGGHQCNDNVCAVGCMADSDCADPATVCNTTSGACVTNASCAGAINGAVCPVNGADLCCGATGVCAAVACCGTNACTVTAANDGTCMQGVCVLNTCAAPTGTTRYVDFSATSGGSGSMACPFNTLDAALTSVGSTGGKIIVKGGVAQTKSIASHSVGAGIEITSSDASFAACTPSTCSDATKWPTLTIGNFYAFAFTTAGVRTLHYFNITGAGAATSTNPGVSVTAATVSLDHLVITGFQQGVTSNTGATVKIGGGVKLNNNSTGLSIRTGGTSTGGAADVEVGAGDGTTFFSSNLVWGVYCEGNGKLTINAVATPTNGVFINSNGASGIRFYSSVAGSITGVVAESNGVDITQTYRDGMTIYAKAVIKVRGSTFDGNAVNGIHVIPNGGNTADGLSNIDLGTTTSAGGNGFQGNVATGVCLESGPATAATNKTFHVAGNKFDNNATCTGANALTHGPTCTGGIDVSGDCQGAFDVGTCTYIKNGSCSD